MAEPSVYLEKLSAFSRILRLEGLPVSPKETEDAGRLLISLGLAFVQTLVALQSDQIPIQSGGHDLGNLRLAHTGSALNEQRPPQL